MKRLTWSVVITGVLGLAAYTMAGAQGPGRGPGFDGPRGGFGRGGGQALRGIELTDDQKEQIKAIREADGEVRQGPPVEVQLHRQLQGEIFADAPDPQKLTALQQQIGQAQSARLAKRTELEQKIAQVLTAEQRATVRERLAQAPQERGRRGGRAR
ncbi:MAG: Spy/CpxP family protein refolding chaperone [Vicinamibacterales bacterium]